MKKNMFYSLLVVSVISMFFAGFVFAETIVDDKDDEISYVGEGWRENTGGGARQLAINNTLEQTDVGGDYAELTFEGTYIEFYGRVGGGGAIAEIYIDGELVEEVDTFQRPAESGVLIFEKRDLAPGQHTIRVTHSGKQQEEASLSNIFIDAFKYGTEEAAGATETADTGGNNQETVSEPAPQPNPKTGDNGIIAFGMLFAGALIALYAVIRRQIKSVE